MGNGLSLSLSCSLIFSRSFLSLSSLSLSLADYIEAQTADHDWDSAADGTNRFATILLYMSDVEDGCVSLPFPLSLSLCLSLFVSLPLSNHLFLSVLSACLLLCSCLQR